MRQLELFSALQSSTEGIDTEFKSARGGMPDAAQLRTVLWGQLNDRHKVSTNLLRALSLRQATLAKAFSPVPSNQVQT